MADADPKEKLPIKQIVNNMGLEFEIHPIETEDGYILQLHRIFNPKFKKRKPIFLQHGILSSSECFILSGEKSLSYILANKGYDVWLGNSRGTLYGYDHKTLNPYDKNDKEKFFNYSFFELGKYDAPAMIDYVRIKTKKDKIPYIGHS